MYAGNRSFHLLESSSTENHSKWSKQRRGYIWFSSPKKKGLIHYYLSACVCVCFVLFDSSPSSEHFTGFFFSTRITIFTLTKIPHISKSISFSSFFSIFGCSPWMDASCPHSPYKISQFTQEEMFFIDEGLWKYDICYGTRSSLPFLTSADALVGAL